MTDEVLERIYSVLLRIEADIGRIRWEALLAEQRGKLVVAPAQPATNNAMPSFPLGCCECACEKWGPGYSEPDTRACVHQYGSEICRRIGRKRTA